MAKSTSKICICMWTWSNFLRLKVKYKIYVDIISGRSLQVKSVYVCGHYLNAEIPSPNSRARVLQSLSGRVGVNNLQKHKKHSQPRFEQIQPKSLSRPLRHFLFATTENERNWRPLILILLKNLHKMVTLPPPLYEDIFTNKFFLRMASFSLK